MSKRLDIIGANTFVDVEGITHVPAKIDTGADSSAICASHIKVKDGVLQFTLFHPISKFYTGEVITRRQFTIITVRSSNGEAEERYRTHLSLCINGRHIRSSFTLANRSKNNFPILIGRRTIRGKFLVDVSQKDVTKKDYYGLKDKI